MLGLGLGLGLVLMVFPSLRAAGLIALVLATVYWLLIAVLISAAIKPCPQGVES
jgi:hypothetical protein